MSVRSCGSGRVKGGRRHIRGQGTAWHELPWPRSAIPEEEGWDRSTVAITCTAELPTGHSHLVLPQNIGYCWALRMAPLIWPNGLWGNGGLPVHCLPLRDRGIVSKGVAGYGRLSCPSVHLGDAAGKCMGEDGLVCTESPGLKMGIINNQSSGKD